ncbi:MAG: VWA domain-containing protein [Aestuariivita sp.]|nr:VWA domain-containing protein [Aestuariivita sp.]
MFFSFFDALRKVGIPVSLREFLTFLESLKYHLTSYNIDSFYYLARTSMVKDERHFDKFDRAFSNVFKGIEQIGVDQILEAVDIPAEWLQKITEKYLTEQEKAEIEALGGFEELMKKLRERLAEQQERHQGGNKWIGTAGTSPFGAYGYNPSGVRIGQTESRHQRAVKVWDKREFSDFDDTIEIGTRNIKVALKRLRCWAREGADEELDMDSTIRATAEHGYLDVKTRPERRNAIKILLFLDVGGSMDPHIQLVEELFSAARAEFKHLEYYYFHNCLYEGVWQNNKRRWEQQLPTMKVLQTYGSDYKCIFVGDASMSPFEIIYPGGANEHWNKEAGEVWLSRACTQWKSTLWINPIPRDYWDYTPSIGMIRQIFEDRMVPLTLEGLNSGMKKLMN